MALTLTPEATHLIEQHLKSGRFSNPSELITTALKVLDDTTPEDLAALNDAIEEGVRSSDSEHLYSEEEARAFLRAQRAQL